MKLFHIIIGPLFICALLHAADPLQLRKGEIPASGLYVPVSVDGYASDKSGAGFSESHVTVANVPFDLVMKAGADDGWQELRSVQKDLRGFLAMVTLFPWTNRIFRNCRNCWTRRISRRSE